MNYTSARRFSAARRARQVNGHGRTDTTGGARALDAAGMVTVIF